MHSWTRTPSRNASFSSFPLPKLALSPCQLRKKLKWTCKSFISYLEFVSSPLKLESGGSSVTTRKILFENFRQQSTAFFVEVRDCIDKLIPQAASENPSSIIEELLSEKSTCSLHLDDAVTALRNLTLRSNTSDTKILMKDVQSPINRKVQEALLAVQPKAYASFQSSKNNRAQNHHAQPQKKRSLKRSFNSSKQLDEAAEKARDLICYDCGESGHRRGDELCPRPSPLTKKRKNSTNKDLHPRKNGNGFQNFPQNSRNLNN